MSFAKLSQLLQSRLKKTGVTDKIYATQILDICPEVMAQIVGREVLVKIKPLSLNQGVLELASLSSLLTARCQKMEGRILFELNRPFGRKLVTKIRYKN